MEIDAERLSGALDGRLPDAGMDPGMMPLVHLAQRLRALPVPGPTMAAMARMEAGFERTIASPRRHPAVGWLRSMLPLAGYPGSRPARVAGGALLTLAFVSAASAATGVSPEKAVSSIAEAATTVINTISPFQIGENAAETPTATPAAGGTSGTSSPTVMAGALANPSATASPSPASSATPRPAVAGATPTGALPTATARPPTATPTARPTERPERETPEPGETAEPTETPEPRETPEPTQTPEPRETPEPTQTPEPRETPEPTQTPEPKETPEVGH